MGGQTVILGNVMFVIGIVSMVVFTGLSAQDWKDWLIINPAVVKPEMTTRIHNSLAYFLSVEMWFKPLIEEDSRKDLTVSMAADGLKSKLTSPQ